MAKNLWRSLNFAPGSVDDGGAGAGAYMGWQPLSVGLRNAIHELSMLLVSILYLLIIYSLADPAPVLSLTPSLPQGPSGVGHGHAMHGGLTLEDMMLGSGSAHSSPLSSPLASPLQLNPGHVAQAGHAALGAGHAATGVHYVRPRQGPPLNMYCIFANMVINLGNSS